MTWAEFKAALERFGIQDSDIMVYIDVEGAEDFRMERKNSAAGTFFRAWMGMRKNELKD